MLTDHWEDPHILPRKALFIIVLSIFGLQLAADACAAFSFECLGRHKKTRLAFVGDE